jgi:hypothetical protein
MSNAQPLNATFFAFRRRERGGVLTGLTIGYLVMALVVSTAFLALNYQGILDYISWYTDLLTTLDPSDPNAIAGVTPPASVMALGPMYLLFMFVTYLLFAAYEAGCLRWMIRGETSGLLGLSLGADTWRVWAGYWLWLALFFAAYIGAIIIMVVVSVVAGLAASGAENSGAGAALAVLLAIAALFAYLFAWTYFAVRLAPAAAASVGRQTFSFFEAWKVTRGRFWALFGAYLLLMVLFMIVYFVAYIAAAVVVGFSIAGQMQTLESDPSALFAALANPATIAALGVFLVIMFAASMMLYVGMFGVNARAVLAAAEDGKIDGVATAKLAETFS